jgi:hypothetical protein
MTYYNLVFRDSPEEYRFYVPYEITVQEFCDFGRNMFNVKEELVASIYGGLLQPDSILSEHAIQDDRIILSRKDKQKIVFLFE